MNKNILTWLLCMMILNSCSYKRKLTARKIILSPLYSSGMVIQTSPHTCIHGYATPGSTLAVRISDYIRLVHSDSTGMWQVQFPEIILSQPFSLFVEGSDTIIELKNVLAGKVIVIAGDAYLDPVSALSETHCSKPEDLALQHIKVYKALPSDILLPSSEFRTGKWLSAEEAMHDANTCKVIRIVSKLPAGRASTVGIVDLTWPGSTLEAWMPGAALQDSVPEWTAKAGLNSVLKSNDKIFSTIRYMADTCHDGIKRGVRRVWFDDEFWKETSLPANISKKIDLQKKRIVHLRKYIYISSRYLTSDFIIRLGKIHGWTEFYFNEVKIDPVLLENGQTQLTIPDTIMRVWSNLLAVKLFCTDSLAGIYGTEFTCTNADSTFRVNIDQKWKYNFRLEADFPRHTNIEKYPSALYNGMLSPMLDHAYSSFIWYGGFNDMANTTNFKTDLCKFLRATGCNDYFIAYDASKEHDTLVYGQGMKQLEHKLVETAKSCDAKTIVATE